jgi:hypothetical protein
LGFFNPSPVEAFQRFHAVCGVILHPLEDDEAIAGRFDHLAEYLEALGLSEIIGLQGIFDQLLGGLFEGLLHFADADAAMTGEHQVFFGEKPCEEA